MESAKYAKRRERNAAFGDQSDDERDAPQSCALSNSRVIPSGAPAVRWWRRAVEGPREVASDVTRPRALWAALLIELSAFVAIANVGSFYDKGNATRFVAIFFVAAVAFLVAATAFKKLATVRQAAVFWVAAIVFHIVALAAAPGDDLWRYLWEGKIQLHGFNPYLVAPDSPTLVELREPWWYEMNHTYWPAVYPPLTETIFAMIARVSLAPIAFKIVFALANLGVIGLLLRLNAGNERYRATAWYAWNPAVIAAFAGFGHFDSLMLLAMTGAICALDRATIASDAARVRWALASALLLGVAISIKIVPLFLLPVWFFVRSGEKTHRVRTRSHPERSGAKRNEVEGSREVTSDTTSGPPDVPRGPSTSLRSAQDDREWAVVRLASSLALPLAAVLLALAVPFSLAFFYGGWKVVAKPLNDFAQVARFNDLVWWLFERALGRTFGDNVRYNVVIALAVLVLTFVFRKDWRRGALWVFGAAIVLSPVLHPWYATWILPIACWRGARAWTVFSLSVMVALLAWETGPWTGDWEPGLWARAVVALPPVIAFAASALSARGRKQNPGLREKLPTQPPTSRTRSGGFPTAAEGAWESAPP
jgi:hypothetical protein